VPVRFTSCARGASASESSIFADMVSGLGGDIEEICRILLVGDAPLLVFEAVEEFSRVLPASDARLLIPKEQLKWAVSGNRKRSAPDWQLCKCQCLGCQSVADKWRGDGKTDTTLPDFRNLASGRRPHSPVTCLPVKPDPQRSFASAELNNRLRTSA
jgi:hypothetical protein